MLCFPSGHSEMRCTNTMPGSMVRLKCQVLVSPSTSGLLLTISDTGTASLTSHRSSAALTQYRKFSAMRYGLATSVCHVLIRSNCRRDRSTSVLCSLTSRWPSRSASRKSSGSGRSGEASSQGGKDCSTLSKHFKNNHSRSRSRPVQSPSRQDHASRSADSACSCCSSILSSLSILSIHTIIPASSGKRIPLAKLRLAIRFSISRTW